MGGPPGHIAASRGARGRLQGIEVLARFSVSAPRVRVAGGSGNLNQSLPSIVTTTGFFTVRHPLGGSGLQVLIKQQPDPASFPDVGRVLQYDAGKAFAAISPSNGCDDCDDCLSSDVHGWDASLWMPRVMYFVYDAAALYAVLVS
jgi:hypothetical protein